MMNNHQNNDFDEHISGNHINHEEKHPSSNYINETAYMSSLSIDIRNESSVVTKEAQLLREAARLLHSVETDRNELELKLKEATLNASKAINDLEAQLKISHENYAKLQESSDKAAAEYEDTINELQAKLNDLQHLQEYNDLNIITSNREKEIMNELNESINDENKSLKLLIAAKDEEINVLWRKYNNDVAEADEIVEDIKSENNQLKSGHSVLHQQLHISQLKQLLDHTTVELSSRNSKIAQLEEKISNIKLEKESIEKINSDILVENSYLKDSNSALTIKLEESYKYKSKSNGTSSTDEEYIKRIHELSDELAVEREKSIALAKQVTLSENAASAVVMASLSSEKSAVENIEKLNSRISELEASLASSKHHIETLSTHLQDTKTALDAAERMVFLEQTNVKVGLDKHDDQAAIIADLQKTINEYADIIASKHEENVKLIHNRQQDIAEITSKHESLSRRYESMSQATRALEDNLLEFVPQLSIKCNDPAFNIQLSQSDASIAIIGSNPSTPLRRGSITAEDSGFFQSSSLSSYEKVASSELASIGSLILQIEQYSQQLLSDRQRLLKGIMSREAMLVDSRGQVLHLTSQLSKLDEENRLLIEKQMTDLSTWHERIGSLETSALALSHELDTKLTQLDTSEKELAYHKQLVADKTIEFSSLIESHEKTEKDLLNRLALAENEIANLKLLIAENATISVDDQKNDLFGNQKVVEDESLISNQLYAAQNELSNYKQYNAEKDAEITRLNQQLTLKEEECSLMCEKNAEITLLLENQRISCADALSRLEMNENEMLKIKRLVSEKDEEIANLVNAQQIAEEEKERLLSENLKISSENSKQLLQLEEMLVAASIASQKISSLQQESNALSDINAQQKSHIEVLSADIEALKSSVQASKASEQITTANEEQIKSDKLRDAYDLEDKLRQAQASIKLQRDIETELKSRILVLENKLEAVTKENEEKIANAQNQAQMTLELKEELLMLKQRNSEDAKMIDELNKQIEQSDKLSSDISAECSELSTLLDLKDNELRSSKGQFQFLEEVTNKKQHEMTMEKELLIREINHLHHIIDETASIRIDHDRIALSHEQQGRLIINLQNALSSTQKDLNKSNEKIGNLQFENNLLSTKIEEITKKHKEELLNDSSKRELEEKIASLTASLEGLMTQYSTLVTSCRSMPQSRIGSGKEDTRSHDSSTSDHSALSKISLDDEFLHDRVRRPSIAPASVQTLDDAQQTIISLEFEIAVLASELLLIKEREKLRLFHEVEARKDVERQLGNQVKDADFLLQELIQSKINFASLNDDLAIARKELATFRREHDNYLRKQKHLRNVQNYVEPKLASSSTHGFPSQRAVTPTQKSPVKTIKASSDNRGRRAVSMASGGDIARDGMKRANDAVTSVAGNLLRLFDDSGNNKKASVDTETKNSSASRSNSRSSRNSVSW